MIAPGRRAIEIADNRVRIPVHCRSRLAAIPRHSSDAISSADTACTMIGEKAAERIGTDHGVALDEVVGPS